MSQAQTLKNFLSVQKKGSINTKDSVTKKRALTILDAALLEAPPVKKTRTSLRLSSKLETKELPSTEFAEPEAKDTSSVLSGPTQNIIDRILTRSRRKLVQPKLAGFINSPEPSSDKVKEIQNVTKDVAKLIESNFSFDNVLDTEAINRSENDVKLPADNCLESKAEISAANKSTDSDTVEALEPIKKVPGYIKYRHLLQSTPSNDSHSKAQEAPKETTLVSANTTPKTTVPGFKKHGHLLAGKIELPLPEKFETLEKIFHALHHTIVFFKSQNLNCVYHRMKKPVENMCNRTFTLDHLAQIKTVYPEAFRYEALKYMHQGQRIESVLLEVDDAEEKLYDNQTNIYETLKLAGSKLELRLKEFRRRLINIVKAEHEKFLASLSIGVDVNNRALLKWHPQFDLNTVPDIPKSDLPTLDRPVISIAKSLRLEKSKSSTEDEEKNTVPSDASGTTPHSSALAKASSLLDRIRAKEKKRNEDIMFGLSPEILSRKTMLSRIPAIADSINFIFTSSKKTVLRQGEVVRKIIESYKTPLSEAEVMDHLKLVSELAPKWLKLMPIGNSVMVKLDRLSSVKDVKEIFKTELQKVTS